MSGPRVRSDAARVLLLLGLLLGGVVAGLVALSLTRDGSGAWARLLKADPFQHLSLVVPGVLLGVGALAVRWLPGHRAAVGAVALLTVVHLQLQREQHRPTFDFQCYRAATLAMAAGSDIYDPAAQRRFNKANGLTRRTEFLYTPLLPVVLAAMPPEEDTFFFNWSAAVLFSLVLCWVLLYAVFVREGFSPGGAALLLLALGVGNAAFTRTLVYTQINGFALAAVLGALLAWPRRPWLSAACLVLAVDLKVSPAALGLAFLAALSWRWVVAFVASQALVVAATSWEHGVVIWTRFLDAVRDLTPSEHRRSPAADAVFKHVQEVWPTGPDLSQGATLYKGALLLGVLWLLWRIGRALPREERPWRLAPILLMASLAVSPFVWSHHFVFAVWPVAALLPRIRGRAELGVWGLMVASFFWVPEVDPFPFSAHRMVALWIYFALAARTWARAPDLAGLRSLLSPDVRAEQTQLPEKTVNVT